MLDRIVPPPPPPAAPTAPAADAPRRRGPPDARRLEAHAADREREGRRGHRRPGLVAPPYLTTDPAGALVFWAPVAGATTKHSDHARTELNSLTNFTAGTERHSLTASVDREPGPRDRART